MDSLFLSPSSGVGNSLLVALAGHLWDIQQYDASLRTIDAQLRSSIWLSTQTCLSSVRTLRLVLFVANGSLRFFDQAFENQKIPYPEHLRSLGAQLAASLSILVQCFTRLCSASPLLRWRYIWTTRWWCHFALTTYSEYACEMMRYYSTFFHIFDERIM